MTGIILTPDFRDLINKFVKPNEPLLRIGFADNQNPNLADWIIELKIPQKHIGQVLSAYKGLDPKEELDVDVLLVSAPTSSFRGKLARAAVASEATPDRDAHGESEPVVLAKVRVSGADIPEGSRLPADALITGTEIHARVRCGSPAMGYSLFYGVWEFLYEKVVFFF